MKKNGFTLVELLVSLAVLGLVLLIGFCALRGTTAAAAIGLGRTSDNEIFTAARNYVIGEDIPMDKGYTCVRVSDLVQSGYLIDEDDLRDNGTLIKVSRNKTTLAIDKIKYVSVCK